jgi:TRAP transporter 4TM/12TM fusion protein
MVQGAGSAGEQASRGPGDKALSDLVASTDTGGRDPDSRVAKLVLLGLALAWSLFQLWYASPLPFIFNFAILNDTEARSIHLAFAIFLAFAAYPTLKSSPRHKVPVQDWALALIAAFCAAYQFLFYETLSQRIGLPMTFDLIVSGVGMLCLLEATRRALGPPLMIVAVVFLAYIFFGSTDFVPDVIQWKGASFGKAMWHLWLQTEGVFGVPLGVSTSFVFLFVLFGSLLDKAGAGNYFIQVAFAFLGHMRGGPAKAAVVSSGMTGLISGSSIANVVTTGTFTIPLMKKVGFSSEKAGAVEVASSVNGQLMPPVMGAAAFLMVEYVGIPYFEVIKHAFLPAVISYIALLYIVHLEALKQDLRGLPRRHEPKPLMWMLISLGLTVASIAIVAGGIYWLFQLAGLLAQNSALFWGALIVAAIQFALYFGVRRAVPEGSRWRVLSTGGIVLCNLVIGAFGIYGLVNLVGDLFGPMAPYVTALLVIALYVGLVWYSTRFPPLKLESEQDAYTLPDPGPTVKAGLYFLPPVGVLVWALMVERLSPGLSAFWATAFMILILLTQRPLRAFFAHSGRYMREIKSGVVELLDGMIAGARNMIGIGVATAAAGIIVGAVTLTGIGQVMTEFVEFVSGGSVILMLLFTAVLSLILGMGLPTTANYIVVATLMAPVVVELGSQVGLVVELIAVHLFVFYFGIMADVTPPVGLASFAAAAVSGGDPIRTGFTAFFYSLRTVLLPFIFIFNGQLLLIGVTGPVEFALVVFAALAGILTFAAATQGFFVARSRIWETALLLLVAFTFLRPGYFMDQIQPPTESVPPTQIMETAADAPANTSLRLVVEGLSIEGDEVRKTVLLPLGEADGKTGEERLESSGLILEMEGGDVVVDRVAFASRAEKLGLEFGYKVVALEVPTDQPPKELFYIPALLLLGAVYWLQRGRGRRHAARTADQAAQ